MWSEKKSLALTRVCVEIFTLTSFAASLLSPWLGKLYNQYRYQGTDNKSMYFTVTIFFAGLICMAALYFFRCILATISKDEVFSQKNIKYMRAISWLCILMGILCFVSSFYHSVFIVVAAAAAFIALLLRVIKNVFAKAVQIKEENDLTI